MKSKELAEELLKYPNADVAVRVPNGVMDDVVFVPSDTADYDEEW